MANQEHIQLLRADVDEWNRWRSEDPALEPHLAGAELIGADLALADLSRADLRYANLALANLKGADLRGADLRGANLVGARLIGVDLTGADISGANLSTAEDLTLEQFDETIGDESTRLPDGVSPPTAGCAPSTRASPDSSSVSFSLRLGFFPLTTTGSPVYHPPIDIDGKD